MGGISRGAANLGRCLGVMLGCLIGMLPLLFINPSAEDSTSASQSADKE